MDDVSPTAPLISVVIPLYNEGSHLRELLADLKRPLQDVGCRFEVVLVDDGSSDDTWTKVKDEARIWPDLRAIRLSRNFGKELAPLLKRLSADEGASPWRLSLVR